MLSLVVLGGPVHGWGAPTDARYANDTDGIFWFMHISDIHVGADGCVEPGEIHDPENFVFIMNDAVEVIKPVFVVATGDLVNGCRNHIPTSGQSEDEWNQYKSLYTSALSAHPYPYYDVVGNHDEYASRFPDECPSLHWYLDYSYRGSVEHAAHFGWTHTTSLGEYYFYAVNATGECVGAFTAGDGEVLESELQALRAALEDHADANLVFVFAHQGPIDPEHLPTNGDALFDEVAKHGAFYIHGHVHEYKEALINRSTGYFVAAEVNSVGKASHDNIAVGVVDHDAFIYRATSTADPWPFVIVTAPVSTRLRNGNLNPWAYRVCKDKVNPVRALVFAPTQPSSVTVQVGSGAAVPMTQVNGPLWKAEVDTSFVAEGEADVTVTAVLSGGATRSETVRTTFVAGPCEVQSDAGVLPSDGSAGDGNVASDSGVLADGSQNGDAGADGGIGEEPSDGCGCRAAGTAGLGWPLLIVGFVLFCGRYLRSRGATKR